MVAPPRGCTLVRPACTSWRCALADCTSSDTVRITTYPCQVTIPNIITPNVDARNQAFVLRGLVAPDWALQVNNRWGREIYQQAS